MSTYLSFDCANKSLAYTHITINLSLLPIILDKIKFISVIENVVGFLKDINELLKSIIVIHSICVYDLFPDVKISETDEIFRVRALYNKLLLLPSITKETIVLIEKQPAVINYKSSTVADQLLMYYVKQPLVLVNPSGKNKIHFNANLQYNVIEQLHKIELAKDEKKKKENNKYKINKLHCKENFLYFLKVFRLESLLTGIKKAHYKDAADSFMQAVAYDISHCYK